MEHFAVPTRVQQEDFLVQLYFGDGSDYLHLCVNRAYLDLSRTLHGIGEMPNLRGIATDEVKKALVTLRDNVEITNQEIFDE